MSARCFSIHIRGIFLIDMSLCATRGSRFKHEDTWRSSFTEDELGIVTIDIHLVEFSAMAQSFVTFTHRSHCLLKSTHNLKHSFSPKSFVSTQQFHTKSDHHGSRQLQTTPLPGRCAKLSTRSSGLPKAARRDSCWSNTASRGHHHNLRLGPRIRH